MGFSEEEIKEIEDSAALSPAVDKLWREHKEWQSDMGKAFYSGLLHTAKCLDEELKSVSLGTFSKRRILTSESKEWKRIFSLLVNSKKILAGLDAGHELMNGKEVVAKDKKSEKVVEEEEISLTDKMANQKK